MKRRHFFIATFPLLFGLLLSGCTFKPPKPAKTQLQVREMQTRNYQNKVGDFKRVMKAVINVLQDDGYIIKNADKELGFITAVREAELDNAWEKGLSIAFGSEQSRYRNNRVSECSVNISERGKEIRVRAIFQNKVLDNYGAAYSITHVEEPKYYQEFFARVDKGLFLEEQGF